MKFFSTILLSFFLCSQLSAQTYAEDVAPIIFDHCTSCHHDGGIAPFALMTYAQTAAFASLIQTEVNNGDMPPWPPSTSYSELAHVRTLSAAEIATINNWVNAGAPQGNPANTPPTPVYTDGPKLGTPDLTIQIPTYISKATSGQDDYVCFSIPSGLFQNRIVQAIEIIPGDYSIVHHTLVHIDPLATYPTDTTSHICGGPTDPNMPMVGVYEPGGSPFQFPNSAALKMGVSMAAGSNIVISMHYPEGSQGKMDSTKVHFHFYPTSTTNVRPVYAYALLYDYNFTIHANTVDSVDAWYPDVFTPFAFDFSVYSVFPHAHLLGKEFIVYAVNHYFPYDQIPLIHIPKWDFEWQDFYVFKYLQRIPAGYKLYGKCIYDNTTNNPSNPNNPPMNVGFGANTSDEMFFVTFQYLTYQFGDENIHVDSLLKAQNSVDIRPLATNDGSLFLSSYPNPSDGLTTIEYYSKTTADISLAIYDIQGKLVRQLITASSQQGQQFVSWDGTDDQGNLLPVGVYFSQLKAGNKVATSKLIRN